MKLTKRNYCKPTVSNFDCSSTGVIPLAAAAAATGLSLAQLAVGGAAAGVAAGMASTMMKKDTYTGKVRAINNLAFQ